MSQQKLSNIFHKIRILSTLIVTLFCQTALADVSVNINLTDAEHHYAKVVMVIPPSANDTINLTLPTWRTGRYEILNLSDGIREFSAFNKFNDSLSWIKTDKSTWKISGDLANGAVISYQVYGNGLGLRTRHIDDSHAFLDASAVVMYTEETRSEKHIITLDVPENWRSVTGLNKGSQPHQFVAENYDVFVDSPIETGINEYHVFTVDGRDYELVIWGQGNYDSDKMVADLSKLVAQGSVVWPAEYPFSRYVFMVHATSGARGATEHLNSTIIQRNRFQFHDREDYLGFISTAAHEFVHTWNVKQYRPEGLVPYNYQTENYANLIWLSEGSTSYLQNQLLMRGDIMTADEWLKDLAKRIDGYLHKPGRDSQTIAQASFDTWNSQSGDYANNHSVNIYSEGFLVSWMLDFNILTATNLAKSYRDVHHMLYQEYRIPKTFNEADMLVVLNKITGNDYNDWWQENINGYAKPSFDQLLAQAGLEMSYGTKNKQIAFSGIATKTHKNGLEITAVEKNSPAWQAGLTTEDVIVAVDGLRMADNDLKARLKNFKPEQSVEFTFFRRDQLMAKTVTLSSTPAEKLKVLRMKNASDAQKAFFKAWTGLDFAKQENKNLEETVASDAEANDSI